MRSLIFFLIFLVSNSVFALAVRSSSGAWSQHQVTDIWGTLNYMVYLPQIRGNQYSGIILALHGCHQSAQDFDLTTSLSRLADQENLLLIFPEQAAIQNPDLCWNWFLPVNQNRLTGEPFQFMQALAATESHYHVDHHHIFVVGLSAGAIMANVMASCYPDVFAGAAIHSGVEYGDPVTPRDAQDGHVRCPVTNSLISGNLAYSCSGLLPRHLPNIILFHGDSDERVYPCNSDRIFEQWVQMEDWADDGIANGSISVRNSQNRSENPPNLYPYVLRELSNSSGWRIRQIKIHGMAHAWSGGPSQSPYGDPKGPDATQLLWNFFSGR